MAISLKHSYTSAVADEGDTSVVQPSDWNAEHQLVLSTGTLIGRTTASTGAAEEITTGTGLSLSGLVLNTSSLVPLTNVTNTFFVKQILAGDGAVNAPLSITGSYTPSSLSNGDIWFNNNRLFYRQSSTSYQVPRVDLVQTWTATQTFSGGAVLGSASAITASAPFYDALQTWNNAAVVFTAQKVNITDTASSTNSLFLDLQIAGSSRFNINKAGSISTSGNLTVNGGTVTNAASGIFQWSGRGILSSQAAGSVQLGGTDAAAPVAQTFSAQSVIAGTSNTVGQDLILRGSRGTGTGAGGAIIFQTAAAGSAGTSQNSASERFRIGDAGQLGVGGANYGTSGQVLTSGGAATAPSWTTVSGGGGAVDGMYWENNQTVTADYTITTSKNAGTFGPITINSGVTVTVPSGSTWTIV